jgi:hypothetical protein
MSSETEKKNFKIVAKSIISNICDINSLLENSKIESKVANEEEKIEELLSLDGNSLIYDEEKDGYYDLEKVAKVFNILKPPKADPRKKFRIQRTDSVTSLSSTMSSQSIDDVSIQPKQESSEDIQAFLSDIRINLDKIANDTVIVPDFEIIKNNQTRKNDKFDSLHHKLQKFAKELQKIASGDTDSLVLETPRIDKELIDGLTRLNQVRLVISGC